MINQIELETILKTQGFPTYRAKQVIHGIFKENKDNYQDITVLPKQIIEYLNENIPIYSFEIAQILKSKDGKTTKALLKTIDNKLVEAVLMKFDDGRATICVSSQIGCQLGCKFCATGKMGFTRNLMTEEITDQALIFKHIIADEDKSITNVVFMGMGEPFMNYDNVIAAVKELNNSDTFGIGARSITLSTSGLVDGIDKLAEENIQVNLAISLHAPNQELREKIMPIAKKYPLDELISSVKKYLYKTNRRVTYEYIMLNGQNDSPENAKQLVSLLKDQLCHINLIPYNAAGNTEFKKSHRIAIEEFKEIIERSNIPVTVRHSFGDDIAAACGQLANKQSK